MNNLSKLFRYKNENGGEVVFDTNHGYLINKPKGIDEITVSLAQAQGIGQVGATIQGASVQPRPVIVDGIIYGETVCKDKLLSVVRPDLAGRFYADDYYLVVVPTATPTIEVKRKFAHFQFTLLAAYPYWQKDASTSAVLAGLQYHFKFPWKIVAPWKFAEPLATVFINVKNSGQLPVPFTVTFAAKGEVVNPKITNAITGKYMLINKSLAQGEHLTVEISHDKTTVTSTIDGDVRGALNIMSDLYRLAVGDNLLKPEAASGLDNLEVTVNYAAEIVGIAL